MYIFDTSSFRELFHFYPQRFPTLWKDFQELVENGTVLSVKEVLKEISVGGTDHPDTKWAKSHKKIFKEPSVEEAQFIAEIFKVEHFQQSLEQKKLLKGGYFADPFIIASAKVNAATVVTQERLKPKGTKIPNICDKFGVPCTNLEGFMELEEWKF
ncbi:MULTISPECIES: PIN domain-containing protein [Leptolyngbya]|uniref:PIN domain-containing protein n=1 Tax=Leptolyngbya TaxID=47251 RepID=UPI001685F49E|nr:PIN domain-containing protein [Leptolyngbya sp. FACHB-1624]MBD1860033.1 DUF4411 family protein [Leptolyngbya sp. FACHB-1624]